MIFEGDSVVKPENFAPKDSGFVRFAIIVFVRRVYEWMKAAMLDRIIVEKEESIIAAKRFFATKGGLAVFHSYFGAPATVALAEALIATGIKNMLIFGEAGSISPEVNIGPSSGSNICYQRGRNKLPLSTPRTLKLSPRANS